MHPPRRACSQFLSLLLTVLAALWAAPPAAAQDAVEPPRQQAAPGGSVEPSGPEATPGDADSRGVLVRLETIGQRLSPPVEVVLTPTGGGEALTLELLDNGESPDVTAGDGVYAASTLVDADGFDVTLVVGDERIDGGPVAWDADARARDLVIRLADDAINVSAGVPTASPTSALGTLPPGASPIASQGGPLVGAAGTSGDGVSRRDAILWLALGIGLIGLAAVGAILASGAHRRSGVDLPVVPEPPLLGPSTPSLSDGLSVWQVSPDQLAVVLPPLLATLARHHRVLAAMPPKVTAPPVFGGPVYLGPSLEPGQLEDALHMLLDSDGAPPAALLLLDQADPETLDSYSALLPEGVGGIALVMADVQTSLPKLTVGVDGAEFVIGSAAGTTRVRATDLGFKVVEPT